MRTAFGVMLTSIAVVAARVPAQGSGTRDVGTQLLVAEARAAHVVGVVADSVGDTTIGHGLTVASNRLATLAERQLELAAQVSPPHMPPTAEPAQSSVPVVAFPRPDTIGFTIRPKDPPQDSVSRAFIARTLWARALEDTLLQVSRFAPTSVGTTDLLFAAAAIRRAAGIIPISSIPPTSATWPPTSIPVRPITVASATTHNPTIVPPPPPVSPGRGEPPVT